MLVADTWNDIRMQSRVLENILDAKLSTFGKTCFRSSDHGGYSPNDRITHTITLNENENSGSDFHSMCYEIDDLLENGDAFGDSSQVGFSGSNAMTPGRLSQFHTVKRHQEILRDYSQEYSQIKAKIIAHREREDLLGSTRRNSNTITNINADRRLNASVPSTTITGFIPDSEADTTGGNQRSGSQSTVSSSTRLLLDEQDKYHRSNRLIDEHLNAASTIRAALRAQRFALHTASNSIINFTSRFPQVKKLVGKIDWRHKQDSIVLGIVIGMCVLFLIIYRFS